MLEVTAPCLFRLCQTPGINRGANQHHNHRKSPAMQAYQRTDTMRHVVGERPKDKTAANLDSSS